MLWALRDQHHLDIADISWQSSSEGNRSRKSLLKIQNQRGKEQQTVSGRRAKKATAKKRKGPTKHYTENQGLSNKNPIETMGEHSVNKVIKCDLPQIANTV